MIGRTIAHFRVVSKLGAGAMGEVYAAEDTTLGRRVALKVLSTEGAVADQTQLLSEARVAASLDHPNICTVHEVGEDDEGRVYIAMELMEGPTLADVIARGALTPDRACELLDRLAAAMAHAHERGVIHRDLKPANIMLTAQGEPRVMDFGLALRREPGQAVDPDDFGGTLAYLAPEQIKGHPPDERTDVWALGVVFHEMLTGQRPFTGDYPAALFYAIVHNSPPPVATSSPAAAHLQAPLVSPLLARDREDRLPSMDAVRAALAGAATSQTPRSWRTPILTAVAVIVALVAVMLWPDREAPPAIAPSVAVLPLAIAPTDSTLLDFASGFSGEIIAELAQVADLRVIAQSSMRQLMGQNLTDAEIAERLGVDSVVRGTVRQAGGDLFVSAELRDGSGDRVLWSESFQVDPRNALILQASVARAVAATLKGHLSEREERALTETATIDPEAHRAYTKAMALRSIWLINWVLLTGEEHLLTTVRLEPEYAPAWAELGRIYHFLRWDYVDEDAFRRRYAPSMVDRALGTRTAMAELLGLDADAWYLELSRAATARALELDPELGTAHTVHGMNLWGYDQDWPGAAAAFERALSLSPGDNFVQRWYANFLQIEGRCDESIAQARISVRQSPLAFDNKRELMGVLFNCRRWDETDAYVDEILPLFDGRRDEWLLWYVKMRLAINMGRSDEILALADSVRTHTGTGQHAAAGYWLSGLRDEAWELVGGRDTERGNSTVAHLRMLEGQPELALELIERWAEETPPYGMLCMLDSQYDSLHDHPRWIAVAEKLKLPGYR